MTDSRYFAERSIRLKVWTGRKLFGPKGGDRESITVERVKNFLKDKGIAHGVVDDARIAEYLTQEAMTGEAWLIAKGRLPKPGTDARVTYHFDIDPLKIGTVKTTGVIDFKNKGEISQVREGALLAEKIP
jgi:uncharacterized protein (DUF342 family)